MIEEHIIFADSPLQAVRGSAGLDTQLPGCATTVGSLAGATGGIGPGNTVSTDKR